MRKSAYYRLFVVLLITATAFGIMPIAQNAEAQACASNKWTGTFFNNRDLSGTAAATSCNDVIDFNWGQGAPLNGVAIDNFSARWTTSQTFAAAGNYLFTITVDDGARLYVNGNLVIDAFSESPTRTLTGAYNIPAPNTTVGITVDYVDFTGNAHIKVEWILTTGTTTTTTTTGAATGGGFPWTVNYYNNLNRSGTPAAVVAQPADGINVDYGTNAPASGVIVDGWSSQWSRLIDFPAGNYTFTLRADDGAKVILDGTVILDQSQYVNNQNVTVVTPIAAGFHTLVVEHFDVIDRANLFLTWQPAVGTGLLPTGGTVTTPTTATTATGVTATVNVAGLFFRSSPVRFTDNIITTLRFGQQYAALGRSTDATWVQLDVNGVHGWAMAQYLLLTTTVNNLPITDGQSVTPPQPASGYTGILAQANTAIKVRSGPGLGFNRVSGVLRGDIVNVLARSPDNFWLQIEFYGTTGWSYRPLYTIIQGDINNAPLVSG